MLLANENAKDLLRSERPKDALFEYCVIKSQLVLSTCDRTKDDYEFQIFGFTSLKDYYMNSKFYYNNNV